MKKVFLILTLLLAGITASFAQRPFMRDTIRHMEPTYFYQYWLDSADIKYLSTTDSCATVISGGGLNYDIAKYNYTDSTLRVVGVAAIVYSPYIPLDVVDSTYDNWYEYMRLYKNTDTGMTMLAEKPFTVLDTARWMCLYGVEKSRIVSYVYPVHEVYFDQPVTVTDSFYVSLTDYHCKWNPWTCLYLGNLSMPVYYYPLLNHIGACNSTHCYTQSCMRLSSADSLWHHDAGDGIFFIFPIIDTTQPLPDTCASVSHLASAYTDSTSRMLTWARGRYNLSWQVAYGVSGTDSSAWTVLDVSDTSVMLTDLLPDQEYAVCVRAICADTIHYSDWSDTLRFVPSSLGIREADGVIDFTLSPNPTDGRATVTLNGDGCAHALLTVTNAEGKELLREAMTGSTCRIESLPAGLYFVKVSCDSFSKVKKLVVR